jgi:hypothetical protein
MGLVSGLPALREALYNFEKYQPEDWRPPLRAAIRSLLPCVFIVLPACNERQPMTQGNRYAVKNEPFLGPIPQGFANAESREGLQDRMRSEGARMEGILSRLAAPASVSSRTTLVADGLPEISTCGRLSSLYGGFLTRASLAGRPAMPRPGTLVGMSCQQALTALGSALPMVAAGLRGQSSNVDELPALQDDDCTRAAEAARPSKRAAVALDLTKATGDGLYITQYDIPDFHADFEAGGNAEQLATRSQIELDARSEDGRLYHGAAIATFGNTTTRAIDSWRVEVLSFIRNGEARRVWLSTEAAVTYGDQQGFTERTDWTHYVDGRVDEEWSVEVAAMENADDGFDVDVRYSIPGAKPLLQLAFKDVDGACTVSMR